MVLPKEPVPGQKLDATWGRDVVRALKRLTPSGGPGMRVTCGPNGTTFAAVGRAAQSGVHQGEWDRDTDTAGQGFKYTVCCGVKHIPSKYGVYLIFREITVDKYGMIRKISKAKMGLYQNLV